MHTAFAVDNTDRNSFHELMHPSFYGSYKTNSKL